MKFDQATIRILLATRKPFLFALGIGITAFILITAIMIPQIQETISLYGKLNAELPKTDLLKKKLAALESVVNTAEYAQIEIVDDALPSKKPLLELLMSLYTVSSQTGILIQQFQLSPGLVASDSTVLSNQPTNRSQDSYDSIEVNMNVSGTFKQIQEFLVQVEKASPFTTVTEMNITGELSGDTVADKQTRVFQADLTTKTYFFTQPISVRVETPLPVLAVKEQNVLAALASFIPNTLPEQKEIQGGGLEDLFGVAGMAGAGSSSNIDQLLQSPLTLQQVDGKFQVVPSPTPSPSASPRPSPTPSP